MRAIWFLLMAQFVGAPNGTLAAASDPEGELRRAALLRFERLMTATNAVEAELGWRGILRLRGGAEWITRSLLTNAIPAGPGSIALEALRRTGAVEPDLVVALAHAAGLPEESENLTDEDFRRLAALARKGKPEAGELVYRRKELGCMICHCIGGVGGKVGPDLTRLGATTNMEFIVESMFKPNKFIRDGYHSVILRLKDETDLAGVFVRETASQLTLRDAVNREVVIAKDQIETQRIGGSLMPVGLLNALTPQERRDLFRFLSALGRSAAFDGERRDVPRVWFMNAEQGASLEHFPPGKLDSKDWVRIPATVSGALLRRDVLFDLSSLERNTPFLVGTRFHATKAGSFRVQTNLPEDALAWIDGQRMGLQRVLSLNLDQGDHFLVFGLRQSSLPERIQLEAKGLKFLLE